jgi:hypothetical protein
MMGIRLHPFIILAVWLATGSLANAQQSGRYSIIALAPTHDETGHRALILDSQDGYLWEYWSGLDATGKSNEGITFLGKPTLGSVPGETTPIVRSAKKPH